MTFYPYGAPMYPYPTQPVKPKYRGRTFRYNGPVYKDGYIIGYWTGDTRAYTIDKAFYNLTCRARREVGTFVEDESVCLSKSYITQLYR